MKKHRFFTDFSGKGFLLLFFFSPYFFFFNENAKHFPKKKWGTVQIKFS